MSKKRYDIAHLTNELAEGKSLFFSDPPKREEPTRQQNTVAPERANAPTGERANGKRIITRNSFEIYEDQMDSLRERSYEEKRAGKVGSMSAMVRDAIDAFLKKS
jgi:hypothetical protein